MFSQITAQQTWSHIISQQEYCIQCTERGVLLPQQLICSWGPLCKIIRPCISNNLMLMKLLCDESRPLWMRHCHPWGLHSLHIHISLTSCSLVLCFYRIVSHAPKTLHHREHSPFRHLFCVYHTCAQKTEWSMTHQTVRPQFTCSLHHFSRKKDIFMCNKRLKHCNPTIVSLSLKFSIDCFDETASSIEPWIDIYSQLI